MPWVDSGKHLGNILENKIDGMQKDIRVKRAKYINRNNNLMQEFHFAHPVTKFTVNRIYNTNFTGSNLWDFNSEAFESLGKTWNVSVRIMFSLPRTTHRYFIEPITDQQHIQIILMKRFLKFCVQLRDSSKSVLNKVLNYCESDTMTRTGHNLRSILLLANKTSFSEIIQSDLDTIIYKEIPDGEEWRVHTLKELMEIRQNPEMLPNFSYKDIEDLISFVCTT